MELGELTHDCPSKDCPNFRLMSVTVRILQRKMASQNDRIMEKMSNTRTVGHLPVRQLFSETIWSWYFPFRNRVYGVQGTFPKYERVVRAFFFGVQKHFFATQKIKVETPFSLVIPYCDNHEHKFWTIPFP